VPPIFIWAFALSAIILAAKAIAAGNSFFTLKTAA
jgi:hypothetical protein